MTPDQTVLVRMSFDKVRPRHGRGGRKLMATLSVVVNGIDDLPALKPTVERLGRRHADDGVSTERFGPVDAALIWTLEQRLGPDFTPEVRAAWLDASRILAAVMQEAANMSMWRRAR